MLDIIEKFIAFGLPIYDASLSVDGLIRSLDPMRSTRNPHILRDYAFCLIYRGDAAKGLTEIEGAKAQYQKSLDEMPTRDYCATAIDECNRLAKACHQGEQTALFTEWIDASEKALKIKRPTKGEQGIPPND